MSATVIASDQGDAVHRQLAQARDVMNVAWAAGAATNARTMVVSDVSAKASVLTV